MNLAIGVQVARDGKCAQPLPDEIVESAILEHPEMRRVMHQHSQRMLRTSNDDRRDNPNDYALTPERKPDRAADQSPRRAHRPERVNRVERVKFLELARPDAHRMSFTLRAFVALLFFVGPEVGV